MQLVLTLFAVSAVFELIAALGPPGSGRTVSSSIAIIALSFSSGGIVLDRFDILTAGIFILSYYRAINVLRLASSRSSEHHLHSVAWKASAWLIGSQCVLLGMAYIPSFRINEPAGWLAFAAIVLLFSLVVVVLTISHLHATSNKWNAKRIADADLPTVTVAIPARNEDDQLETCLQSVIASDYPKLEVVVLDDCSQDNTSHIIREFAHDGVRFVQGDAPKPNWLAKNQSYDRLYRESNGEIILFCGVDVLFETQTIRLLVTSMKRRRSMMLSVMPENTQNGFSLPQVFRYFWELVPPRAKLHRPPVLSTCWLIKADAVKKFGGFDGVANMITPEAFFAQQTDRRSGYVFLRSNKTLGLTSSKTLSEQFDTAIRVRYPQTHRRPEYVAAASLLEMICFVLPFALSVAGLLNIENNIVAECMFLISVVLLCAVYGNIGFQQFRSGRWHFLIAMPVAAILDVAILNYSMCKYEFSEVIWKGRNVCLPVMRAIPNLPKMTR